jgi:hypothetical protein
MPGCHSGCCRPRQGTSAGTSSVGCGLQVPVYLWPTASCRLRRLGYLLAATDAASLRVRISSGQERSRTWSENGNAGVSFTPPSKVIEMQVLPCRPRWRRQSRVVFSGNGGGVVMVPGTYPGDLVSSSPKKRIRWTQPPDDTVANASCQAMGRVNAASARNEVSQNMSERTSGPLWQVNRSNAFEISRNPWKHTDRAVYGYRLLQRCGFRPGSARNKSARSPRAMSHNPGSDI